MKQGKNQNKTKTKNTKHASTTQYCNYTAVHLSHGNE